MNAVYDGIWALDSCMTQMKLKATLKSPEKHDIYVCPNTSRWIMVVLGTFCIGFAMDVSISYCLSYF